jgi:hypothetical protein
MRDSIKARRAADSSQMDPLHELNSYLNGPLEEVEDIIGWWGVCCILIILGSTVLIFNFSITRFNTQLYLALQKTISPSRARLYHLSVPSQAAASLMLPVVTALLPRHFLPCRFSKLLTETDISQLQRRLSSQCQLSGYPGVLRVIISSCLVEVLYDSDEFDCFA